VAGLAALLQLLHAVRALALCDVVLELWLWLGLECVRSGEVSWAFPSWHRSILTEIYLCHACSYHEVEDGNARLGVRLLGAADADGGLGQRLANLARRGEAGGVRREQGLRHRGPRQLRALSPARGGGGGGIVPPPGHEHRGRNLLDRLRFTYVCETWPAELPC
jgi:hypothetical protein